MFIRKLILGLSLLAMPQTALAQSNMKPGSAEFKAEVERLIYESIQRNANNYPSPYSEQPRSALQNQMQSRQRDGIDSKRLERQRQIELHAAERHATTTREKIYMRNLRKQQGAYSYSEHDRMYKGF